MDTLYCGLSPNSPNLFPLFTLNETFIKRAPLLSGRGHLKVPEMVISIVAKISPPNMQDIGNASATHNFFDFYKTWLDELIWLV